MTISDSADLTKAGDSIRLHAERYEILLATTRDGFLVLDGVGKLLDANEAYCRISGYTPEELLELNIADLEALETSAETVRRIKAVRQSGFERFESRHRRKDGTVIDVEISTSYWGGAGQFLVFVRDITSRKRAEEALRQSEARFEATFEQAAVGIAQMAPDGSWLRVNRKLCDIVGYSEEELLSLTFQDITHPDDVEADLAHLRLLLARDSNVYATEKRCIRKDGSVVWIHLTVALTWKADGQPDYFITVIKEIQERKEAEAALKKSEAILRKTQKMARLGHWTWDFRNDVPTWSEEIYRIFGRDRGLPPATYLEVQEYFTADSWARLSSAVTAAINEGTPYEVDVEVIRPDGSHCWLVARGEPVRDSQGGVVELQGMMQDITDRKLAEQVGQIGNWRLDVRHNKLLWSDQVYRIFGLPREEPLSYERFLAAVHPDDRHYVDEQWQAALSGEPYHLVHRVLAGGEVRWVSERAELEFDLDGALIGGFGTAQDITELKRAEQEIRRLNAGLEKRVAERTAELNAANTELDAFAYSVSHDLRSPLRAMSGFAAALTEDYGDRLEGEGRVYLERIEEAADRMNHLIDGLLTLSHSARNVLQYEKVDISALAERLLEELAQGEAERQVEVAVQEGLQAHGDPRMVEVVMRNLLGNAWKYTSLVTAPSIRVYADERDDRRWICIADNGIGFDMADVGRLFQPFERSQDRRQFPGAGIGLATVQRIVQRHRGSIEAHGEPEKGAVFCVAFPDSPQDAPTGETDA